MLGEKRIYLKQTAIFFPPDMTILRYEMNTMIWEGSAMPVYRTDAKLLKKQDGGGDAHVEDTDARAQERMVWPD